MSKTITRREALTFLTLSAALSSQTAHAAKAVLHGRAFYHQRIALPDNAVFEVRLLDISFMDIPGKILGKMIKDPSGQVPIAFKIYYNPFKIQPDGRYAISATIKADGKLLFANDTIHPVLTGDPKELYPLELVPV